VDSLTGLPNPRAFAEAATAELDRQRRSGRPLTIAFLDLDRFKEVNDRHGHQAGDALLAEVARCLRSSTRATDHLGRLGGDEFAVLMPETDEVGAERVLERIQASILNAMGEQGWPVTSSIGAVVFPVAPASVDELVGKADQLMYLVKHSGKGAFRIERIDGPPATR
jgi:diguanylate cyclase (GGDEF)-like protein